jgi:hypothetical protein
MGVPFGFHVIEPSDDWGYAHDGYESEYFSDEIDYDEGSEDYAEEVVDEADDHYDDYWDNDYGEEIDVVPQDVRSTPTSLINALRTPGIGSGKAEARSNPLRSPMHSSRVSKARGVQMSEEQMQVVRIGDSKAVTVEALGVDDIGHEVRLARVNGVIIGVLTKWDEKWTAHRIEGRSFDAIGSLERSACFLIEDYIGSLIGSLKSGLEDASPYEDPSERLEVMAESAGLLATVLAEYAQFAPTDGWSSGNAPAIESLEEIPWDDGEPPF